MNTHQQEFVSFCISVLEKFRMSNDVRMFITAQLCLESNFGQSSKAVNFSNCSGMRYPLVRPTLAIGRDADGFAIFDCNFDCIFDYILCLTYHKPFSDVWQSIDSFKHFIAHWYCPEVDYLNKITIIFNQLKSFKNE